MICREHSDTFRTTSVHFDGWHNPALFALKDVISMNCPRVTFDDLTTVIQNSVRMPMPDDRAEIFPNHMIGGYTWMFMAVLRTISASMV